MYQQPGFQGRPEGGPRGPHFGGRFFKQQVDSSFGFKGCGRPGGRDFGGFRGRHQAGEGRSVPVNIEATPESFVLTLFAAGLTKEKIQLSVQDDVLTIAYPGAGPEAANAAPADERRYTRREFHDPAFERAFQLNGKVLADSISARYADGVLTVTLPKDPAANQPAPGIVVE